MEEGKTLWEILVPRCSNEGIEYRVEHHRKWDAQVRQIAGGITILRPARGQWVSSEGELFREEMIPVRVYCTEEDIDRILEYTVQYYNQKAVFAYEVSTKVKIKEREE